MLVYLAIIDNQDEKDKFTQIYNQYKYLMLYVANSVLRNSSQAEDVVHDSFLKIISILDHFDEINCSKTKSLIVLIVKNKAIDLVKRESKFKKSPIENYEDCMDDYSAVQIDPIVNQQDYENLVNVIDRLDDIYKIVLQMKYIHGYSDVEISKILDISTKNVSVRLTRAKHKLKQMLSMEVCNSGE